VKTQFPYVDVYSREHKSVGRYKGYSICPYVTEITRLVHLTNAQSLLDYGCGKGYQYLARRVHDNWGGLLPWCYDIGVSELKALPENPVDGIICTDVMEHIDGRDIDTVLNHIFSLVADTGFVFFAVACRPANKKFKHYGRRVNVHLTVKPPEWWDEKIAKAKTRSGKDCLLSLAYDEPVDEGLDEN